MPSASLTPLDDALDVILAALAEVDTGTEWLPLEQCSGRLPASDVWTICLIMPLEFEGIHNS